ncbi:NADP oxidoreductase coenzyme F420-dependent family protein [Helicobacter pylori SouthAfrica50]|uniref:NADP oxidoreductase coenzyme F420-dependent family protein n=1 Tax=Helicobacter pylori SouthAfrica50 TaxID=1352357 RepID=T2SCR9_HELPX|nr:NADP oxidoreductase coenzyme F420-dependent family protein [Helicobacter pylori SouthAfrica50]
METLQFIGYGNMAQAILEGSHEILSKRFILEITGRNPEKIAPFLQEKTFKLTSCITKTLLMCMKNSSFYFLSLITLRILTIKARLKAF